VDGDENLEIQSAAGANDADSEMLEMLLSVQFGPALMAAMNQDEYFIQALQNPVLLASMQQVRCLLHSTICFRMMQLTKCFVPQLMASPKDFAISTALQQPAVREFILKLIALSCEFPMQSCKLDLSMFSFSYMSALLFLVISCGPGAE